MRVRVVIAMALVIVVGFLIIHYGGGSPATAQTLEPRPLMVNEIREWCGDDETSFAIWCDEAQYLVRPDGAVHVLFNYDASSGVLDDDCATNISVPDDVDGWAFVVIAGEFVGVGTPPPTASSSDASTFFDQLRAYDDAFAPDRRMVVTIPELRDIEIARVDQVRVDTVPLQVCELVVRRTQ